MRSNCSHDDSSERGLDPLFVLREHNYHVMCGSFYPTNAITYPENMSEALSTNSFRPNSSVEIRKFGHLFISGDAGGVVNIWDLNLRRVIYTFRPVEMLEKWMVESGHHNVALISSQGSNVGLLNVGFLSLQINQEHQSDLGSTPSLAESERTLLGSAFSERELSQHKENINADREFVSVRENNRTCPTEKIKLENSKTDIGSNAQSNHHDNDLPTPLSITENGKQCTTSEEEQLRELKRPKYSGVTRQMHERGFRKFFARKHHRVVNNCNNKPNVSNANSDHHGGKLACNTMSICCDNGTSDSYSVYIYTQCRTRCLYIWEVKINDKSCISCNSTKSEKQNLRVNNMQTDSTDKLLENKCNNETQKLASSSLTLLHCIPVPQYGFCQVACEYDERTNSYLFAIPHDAQSTFSVWALTLCDEWRKKHEREKWEHRKQLDSNADVCAHPLPNCFSSHSMQYHLQESPFLLNCLCTSSATSSLSNINGGAIMSLTLSSDDPTNVCSRQCKNDNNCSEYTNSNNDECIIVSTRHLTIGLESGHVALCKLHITRHRTLENFILANKSSFSTSKQILRSQIKEEQQEMSRERSENITQEKTCVKNDTNTSERKTEEDNNDIVKYKNKSAESHTVHCVCQVLRVLRLFTEPAMTCVWSATHNYLLASSASGEVHCYFAEVHSQGPTSLLASNMCNESEEQTNQREEWEQHKEEQKNELCVSNKSNTNENEVAVQEEYITIRLLWQKSFCKGVGSANFQRHLALLGSWDGSVRLFDARTGRVVSILLSHSSTINALTAMDVRTSGRVPFAFDVREPHTYSQRLYTLRSKQVPQIQESSKHDLLVSQELRKLELDLHKLQISNNNQRYINSSNNSNSNKIVKTINNDHSNEQDYYDGANKMECNNTNLLKKYTKEDERNTVECIDKLLQCNNDYKAQNVYVLASMSNDCTIAIWRVDFNVMGKEGFHEQLRSLKKI